MTTQLQKKIFTKVAKHLLKQKAKAQDSHMPPLCVYRAEDGKKCAVGCLIAKRYYNAELEGRCVADDYSLRSAVQKSLGAAKPLSDADLALLGDLQDIHDDEGVENWSENLQRLAKELRIAWPLRSVKAKAS